MMPCARGCIGIVAVQDKTPRSGRRVRYSSILPGAESTKSALIGKFIGHDRSQPGA
jgi:hypothetical protein